MSFCSFLVPPLVLHILLFLQSLLSVHDVVAQKSYDPELPPLPEGIEDDEDSVKIIRLVKNKEPLVSHPPALPPPPPTPSGKSALNWFRNEHVKFVIHVYNNGATHYPKSPLFSITSIPCFMFLYIWNDPKCICSRDCRHLLQNVPITSLLFMIALYFPLTQASQPISIRVWSTTQSQTDMYFVGKGSSHVWKDFLN